MLSWLVSLCLGLLLVQYLSYRWRNRRLYSFAKSLPGPPLLPILGNALEVTGSPKDIVNVFLENANKYPSPFRVWLGHILLIIVSDPDNLQSILTSSKALSKGALYKFFQHSVGNGLFTAPVEKWKKSRRMLIPAFNSKLLEHFIPVFVEKTQILLQLLEKEVRKEEFDIYSYILPMSLDMICQTALGVDVEAQTSPSEFSRAVSCISSTDYTRVYQIWLHPEFLFKRSKLYKTNEWAYKALHRLPTEVIKKRKKEYKEEVRRKNLNPDEPMQGSKELKNFLDILIDLSENGAMLTDEDIKDEVVTMMVAGSETIALTNSFCLLMLAIHQDIQEKVLEEIDMIFGDSNRAMAVEDLTKLIYLEQVLKETLRMWPPGALILRWTEDDIKLKDCLMPAGCTVAIGVYKVHMDEEIYPEPKKFDPNRFTPENISSRHKFSFLPFSGGPRSCIGSKYAMISMKTTLATFFRKYYVCTSCKLDDIQVELGLLMASVNGYPVRIKKRNSTMGGLSE